MIKKGKGEKKCEKETSKQICNGQVLAYAVLCTCAKSKNLLISHIRLVTNYALNLKKLILTIPVLISPKPSKKEKQIRNAFFFAARWRSPPIALKSPNQPLQTLICFNILRKTILTPELGIPVTTQGQVVHRLL